MESERNKDNDILHDKINSLKNLQIDNFQAGKYIDALDESKTWCIAHVVERNGDFIKIHYDGWSPKYDDVRYFY